MSKDVTTWQKTVNSTQKTSVMKKRKAGIQWPKARLTEKAQMTKSNPAIVIKPGPIVPREDEGYTNGKAPAVRAPCRDQSTL